jgi:TRAP-type C4-dicarboxylate transport system permease small subunit
MSSRWFVVGAVVKAVVSFILIGLLIAGGVVVYHTAWSQGYAAGRLAVEERGSAPALQVPYHFGFAPLLLGVGLLLLLLFTVGQVFRLLAWRRVMSYGPMAAHWARRWRWPHGSMPPWFWGEPPGEAWPDAEAGKTTKEE